MYKKTFVMSLVLAILVMGVAYAYTPTLGDNSTIVATDYFVLDDYAETEFVCAAVDNRNNWSYLSDPPASRDSRDYSALTVSVWGPQTLCSTPVYVMDFDKCVGGECAELYPLRGQAVDVRLYFTTWTNGDGSGGVGLIGWATWPSGDSYDETLLPDGDGVVYARQTNGSALHGLTYMWWSDDTYALDLPAAAAWSDNRLLIVTKDTFCSMANPTYSRQVMHVTTVYQHVNEDQIAVAITELSTGYAAPGTWRGYWSLYEAWYLEDGVGLMFIEAFHSRDSDGEGNRLVCHKNWWH